MLQRIPLHAQSCQLKLGVLTLPSGDNKTRSELIKGRDTQSAWNLISGGRDISAKGLVVQDILDLLPNLPSSDKRALLKGLILSAQ